MKLWRVPVIIVLALATLLALSACADSGLDERITSTVDGASGTQLRISDLTDFAWEELHVFPPYTSQKQIDRALGFEWSAPSGISLKDTITLLVFVDDGGGCGLGRTVAVRGRLRKPHRGFPMDSRDRSVSRYRRQGRGAG